MLSVSCNWFNFHREVLRHSLTHTHTHTHLYMYTPALQSAVDVLPEEPCYSLKYRPARADVRPVWVTARWSVSDLSVWLPNPVPPPPESPVRPQLMLKPRPRVWALAGVSWWSFPDRLQSTCEWFVHSKRPTPWLPLSKENLPGRVGNLVQYMCTPGS